MTACIGVMYCEVRGCRRLAKVAVEVTLRNWASGRSIVTEVGVCKECCEAHEWDVGHKLPPTRKPKRGVA